jgi:hypothetical protein
MRRGGPRLDRKMEDRYLIGYVISLFSCVKNSIRQDNSKSVFIIKVRVNFVFSI